MEMLHKRLEDKVKRSASVIELCCILHNICNELGDQLDPSEYEINEDGRSEGNPARVSLNGGVIREEIANYLCS